MSWPAEVRATQWNAVDVFAGVALPRRADARRNGWPGRCAPGHDMKGVLARVAHPASHVMARRSASHPVEHGRCVCRCRVASPRRRTAKWVARTLRAGTRHERGTALIMIVCTRARTTKNA